MRREWVPRKPRWLGFGFGKRKQRNPAPARRGSALDWIDVPVVDEFPAAMLVVAIIVALLLAWFFVFPVLVLLLDIVFLVMVSAAAVAGRVLFRRPWRIVATPAAPGAGPLVFHVRGLRASKAAVADIAAQLEAGLSPRVADAPS